jgi:uncharacterized protein (DUF736 family)
MANIGTFKKSGDTNYTGEIVTMSLQKKNVTIVAEEASDNENAPSHRVFVAKAEIGACWQETSKEGRDYLSIKLDDPSITAPIFASLFADVALVAQKGGAGQCHWRLARWSDDKDPRACRCPRAPPPPRPDARQYIRREGC